MKITKDSWTRAQLGTVCHFKNGFNFNKGTLSDGTKIVGVIDFQDYFTPRFESIAELIGDRFPSREFLIEPDDILFVRSNGNKELVGRTLYVDQVPFPTTFSAFCIRARFNNKNFYPKFYAYYFRSEGFKTRLLGIAQGTNINNLNRTLLSQVEVKCPPLDEQRRITGLLESLDASLVFASEQSDKLLTLRDRLLAELVSERPSFGNLLNGKKLITRRFGDVVKCVDEHERKPIEKGLNRYLGLEHITSGRFRASGSGDVEGGTTFTKTFRKGDVLFGKRRAYLRKVAVAEFDGICSSDILVFRPNEAFLLGGLLPFYAASDTFIQFAVNTSAGSLSPRTKWRDLATFELCLPDVETQSKILSVLRQIEGTVEKAERQRDNLRSLKSKLLNEIFS